MQVEVSANGVDLTETLRVRVEQRIRSALRRFSELVERVHVRLSDENGPKGGMDTACSIRVWLLGIDPVSVQVMEEDIRGAIDFATDCIETTISSKLDRTLTAMLVPGVINPMRFKQ